MDYVYDEAVVNAGTMEAWLVLLGIAVVWYILLEIDELKKGEK